MKSQHANIYLVPRWAGNIHSDWYDWLCAEIKKKYQLEIIRLEMPNWDQPDINKAITFLTEKIKNLDSYTYFIGHSVGCQAVLRYLNQQLISIPELKIGGFLFVAGWFEVEKPWITLKPWLEISGINLSLISNNTHFRKTILSDNDPFTPNFDKNKLQWNNRLNTDVTGYHNRLHFNKSVEPDILKEVEEMILNPNNNQ